MPIFLPSLTLNLKLGAGSASFPDNFTIKIFEWDVDGGLFSTGDVAATGRTYATNVTKAQLANGGAGYTITGITGIDYRVEATSTGTCTSSDYVDIYTDSLSVYLPSSGTLTEEYSGNTDYHSFATNGNPGQLATASVPLATLKTLSYIDPADFSIQYLSGTTADGSTTITGDYANGPFMGYDVQLTGNVFSLTGNANTSLDALNQLIHGYIRLTYVPSSQSVDFNFWYKPISE